MAATGGVGVAESIVDYLIEHGAQLEYKDDQYSSLLEFAYSRDSAVAMHLEKVIREWQAKAHGLGDSELRCGIVVKMYVCHGSN